MNNTNITQKQLNEKLLTAKEIIIYGAGVVAYGVYVALKEVYGITNTMFVVSKAPCDKTLDDVAIKCVDELEEYSEEALFLVATPEIYHKEIKEKLKEKDVKNVLYINSHLEYMIMSRYFEKEGNFVLLNKEFDENSLLNQTFEDVLVGKCHSIHDTRLESCVLTEDFVKPIHVGKALTSEKLATLTDDIGDHISHKNGLYSELTATYWLWKNTQASYKGICHYRRQLLVSKMQMKWCIEKDIDVILPLPFVCYPNTKGQYGRYISKEEQEVLLKSMKDMVPNEMETIAKILEDKYLYNYNMLIAKEKVFDEYCQWIFPILFRAEEIYKEKKMEPRSRVFGYFGEVLTAIFFLKNKEKYNIVHAEKNWYI